MLRKNIMKVVGVTLTLLLLVSLVETPELVQAKSKPPSAKKGDPQMYIIPTSDPDKADQVIQQLKQGKSPALLELIPAKKKELKQKTFQQMEAEAKKSKGNLSC